MADRARQTLCDLLATHGRGLCDDPRRTEALLRDLCGEERRGIFVLVSALRERVPADLQAAPEGLPQELVAARLAQRLCDDLGLAPEVARWGVETWTLALAGAPATAARAAPCAEAAESERWLTATPAEELSGGSGQPAAGAGRAIEPPRLAPSAGPAVTVARHGNADHASIADAVRAAQPGTRILVRPGVYTEPLILDRLVEIVGVSDEGRLASPGQVVVEVSEGHCIRVQTGYAVVRGLSLHGRTGPENRKLFAVDIPEGRALLEDCDVTSDALAAVAIHGRTARPVLRRCQIHDGSGCGIFVHNYGAGTIERCAIFGNALAGVEIGSQGNPLIRRCLIWHGKQAGVYVSLGGGGTFEECSIASNLGAGVDVGWRGSPSLRRCRINGNGRHGLRLYAGGCATVEECDLAGNTLGPWDVEDGRVQHHGSPDGGMPGRASRHRWQETDSTTHRSLGE